MTTVSFLHLMQSHMHASVRHAVQLNGTASTEPAVTAVIAQDHGLGWCLLCDHPDNFGVSVTNGARNYAEAVCRALNCDITDLVWYELDSMGKFDELSLMGSAVGYAPLVEEGYNSRSLEAFFARARQLVPGMPVEAAEAIQRRAELFQG